MNRKEIESKMKKLVDEGADVEDLVEVKRQFEQERREDRLFFDKLYAKAEDELSKPARENVKESEAYKKYDKIVAMPVAGEWYLALIIVFGCHFREKVGADGAVEVVKHMGEAKRCQLGMKFFIWSAFRSLVNAWFGQKRKVGTKMLANEFMRKSHRGGIRCKKKKTFELGKRSPFKNKYDCEICGMGKHGDQRDGKKLVKVGKFLDGEKVGNKFCCKVVAWDSGMEEDTCFGRFVQFIKKFQLTAKDIFFKVLPMNEGAHVVQTPTWNIGFKAKERVPRCYIFGDAPRFPRKWRETDKKLFDTIKSSFAWDGVYFVVAVGRCLEVWSGKGSLIRHRCGECETSDILWSMIEHKGITLHLSDFGITVTREVDPKPILENCVAMDSGCSGGIGWKKNENTFYVLQVVKHDYKTDVCMMEKVKSFVENEEFCNEMLEKEELEMDTKRKVVVNQADSRKRVRHANDETSQLEPRLFNEFQDHDSQALPDLSLDKPFPELSEEEHMKLVENIFG